MKSEDVAGVFPWKYGAWWYAQICRTSQLASFADTDTGSDK